MSRLQRLQMEAGITLEWALPSRSSSESSGTLTSLSGMASEREFVAR
jgi:hypothetical protein